MTFKIEWIDKHREPTCPAMPEYPNGIDVTFAKPGQKSCKVDVPYPAKRCGMYVIECEECGLRVAATTAGRADDPRSVRIPCEKRRDALTESTTLYVEQACPVCQLKLDAATDLSGNGVPKEGDLTLCVGCASFLVFGPNLQLREMSMLEIAELPDEARIELQRMRKAIETVKARRSQ